MLQISLSVGPLQQSQRSSRGKHRPEYTPNVDCGEFVIIINAEKAVLTGKKLDQKFYRRHSGYIGGLKETSYTYSYGYQAGARNARSQSRECSPRTPSATSSIARLKRLRRRRASVSRLRSPSLIRQNNNEGEE